MIANAFSIGQLRGFIFLKFCVAAFWSYVYSAYGLYLWDSALIHHYFVIYLYIIVTNFYVEVRLDLREFILSQYMVHAGHIFCKWKCTSSLTAGVFRVKKKAISCALRSRADKQESKQSLLLVSRGELSN